jgi:hypothetical protein
MNINRMNYVVSGIPAFLCFIGIWIDSLLFWGLLSTIFTGMFQAVVGFKCAFDDPENIFFKIYVFLVIIFFVLWIITPWLWVLALPPALALYLSVLLFIEAKKEKS